MNEESSTEKIIYFKFSNDKEIIRKRVVSLSNVSNLKTLYQLVRNEFSIDVEEKSFRIGVLDSNINDYVLVENDQELTNSMKEKNIQLKIFIDSNTHLPSSSLFSKTEVLKEGKEKELRIQLAAAYRLFDMFGWTDLIYNHLTVAIEPENPGDKKCFLINPFGLLFSEITASSLVKIDIEGNIIEPGNTKFGINKAGYVIHSAIHNAREDIKCIMHCHSNCGVAVSCMKTGLLNICQNSAILGSVSYHDYEGLAVNLEERERIVADLGTKNKNLILKNHGILSAGSNIPEAFFNMFMLNKCCEIQVAALSGGLDNLNHPEDHVQKFTEKEAANFNQEGVGQKEFNALIRKLDSIDSSYRL